MKVVFDLDGTLANCSHRQHLVEAGEWGTYFDACDQDRPIPHAIAVLKALARDGHRVEIWSGRGEGPTGSVRKKTVDWLIENDVWPHVARLLMRPHKNHRKDSDLKADWWKAKGKSRSCLRGPQSSRRDVAGRGESRASRLHRETSDALDKIRTCWWSRKFWDIHDYRVSRCGDGHPTHCFTYRCWNCGSHFRI